MKPRFLHIFLTTAFFILSHHSQAVDPYNEYVADINLHESHQARNPDQPIRYVDGENGALLKSILMPDRVKAGLRIFEENFSSERKVPDITNLMRPLIKRYEAAFRSAPQAYENEYLDCIEALVDVTGTLERLQTGTLERLQTQFKPPVVNKTTGASGKSEQELGQGLKALLEATRSLMAKVSKETATEIRKQVAMGMFTEPGGKRALEIANRLAPQ